MKPPRRKLRPPSRKPEAQLILFLDGVAQVERDLDHFLNIRLILSETQRRIFLQPVFDRAAELMVLFKDLDQITPNKIDHASLQNGHARLIEVQRQVRSLLR